MTRARVVSDDVKLMIFDIHSPSQTIPHGLKHAVDREASCRVVGTADAAASKIKKRIND